MAGKKAPLYVLANVGWAAKEKVGDCSGYYLLSSPLTTSCLTAEMLQAVSNNWFGF